VAILPQSLASLHLTQYGCFELSEPKSWDLEDVPAYFPRVGSGYYTDDV